jgi:hypothetical protein
MHHAEEPDEHILELHYLLLSRFRVPAKSTRAGNTVVPLSAHDVRRRAPLPKAAVSLRRAENHQENAKDTEAGERLGFARNAIFICQKVESW